MTMHKNTTPLRKAIAHESMASCEVLFQIGPRAVQLINPLVGVLVGKLGIEPRSHGQHMRDVVSLQDELIA